MTTNIYGAVPTNSVGTLQLKDLAVTGGKIANTTITEGKIADDAVSLAKLKESEVSRVQLLTQGVAHDVSDLTISWSPLYNNYQIKVLIAIEYANNSNQFRMQFDDHTDNDYRGSYHYVNNGVVSSGTFGPLTYIPLYTPIAAEHGALIDLTFGVTSVMNAKVDNGIWGTASSKIGLVEAVAPTSANVLTKVKLYPSAGIIDDVFYSAYAYRKELTAP